MNKKKRTLSKHVFVLCLCSLFMFMFHWFPCFVPINKEAGPLRVPTQSETIFKRIPGEQ